MVIAAPGAPLGRRPARAGFQGTAQGRPMNWNVLDAVFKRNFIAYFSNPTG